MEKTIGIILIVCAVANLILLLVFGIRKRKKDAPSDSNVLSEVETLNDNLNEVKNIINEHTTREKDSVLTAFNASNSTLILMLEKYMNSFKQTLDENLNTTKEQLNEIREEMQLATRQMSANTTDALEKMQDKTEKSLTNLKDDTGKSLDRMNDEIKTSLKDMREDNQKQLLGVKQDNEKQLEKMRETVDEKLSSTLDKRIQNAFEIVNDRLDKVQRGFGEMQDLSTKVTNLNKMFANVKTRGGWGEVALESLLDQILAPEQYAKQFRLSRSSQEAVDFVIVMPGQGDEKVYLPIDSKFPLDKYIRLVEASEEGDAEKVEIARKSLVDEVKREARSISSKYIKVPTTTNFAVMYVPTEGLYAEIAKDSALTSQLQNDFNVTVCGPTTVTALLNSLQVGFTTLKIQKRSGDIVKELNKFRKDFVKYTELIGKVKKNATTVVTTIEDVEKRNDMINQRLSKVVGDLPVDDDTRLIASDEVTED
ncbi:MAG: DNA recombination protein RmuC [Clostridiales bacterium]|nr:DNA recombination protein RmuC [Clostridiales bacterium]